MAIQRFATGDAVVFVVRLPSVLRVRRFVAPPYVSRRQCPARLAAAGRALVPALS
jgi:hypothetical protein